MYISTYMYLHPFHEQNCISQAVIMAMLQLSIDIITASLDNIVNAMHHISQVNKIFILPLPFNPHLYNIYKVKYIS